MFFVLSSLPSGVANSPPRTALPAGSSRRGLFSFLPAAVSGEVEGESRKNFFLERHKSWRGSFRQVGWAAPGEAGQSSSGRWWGCATPSRVDLGIGEVFVVVVFSISMVLAWTVTQASSSAPSCLGLAHL